MPYASSTGTPSTSSTRAASSAESAEDEVRAKRSASGWAAEARAAVETSRSSRVGTADTQVTPHACRSPAKVLGRTLLGTTIVPPEPKVDSVDPTSPWMWKSGMTQYVVSALVNR
jgi:hypothetical protein